MIPPSISPEENHHEFNELFQQIRMLRPYQPCSGNQQTYYQEHGKVRVSLMSSVICRTLLPTVLAFGLKGSFGKRLIRLRFQSANTELLDFKIDLTVPQCNKIRYLLGVLQLRRCSRRAVVIGSHQRRFALYEIGRITGCLYRTRIPPNGWLPKRGDTILLDTIFFIPSFSIRRMNSDGDRISSVTGVNLRANRLVMG